MIKNKIKIGLMSFMVLALFASGAMALTPAITSEGAISTGDRTPAITFTPVGNNASYLCTLYVGNASGYETSAGTATVSNNTLGTITCNRVLEVGAYTYNVSMYNVTESPTTTFSSNAALKVTTFGVVISMLEDVVAVFTPIVTIIVKIIPIFIAIGVAAFIIGLLASLFATIQRKL